MSAYPLSLEKLVNASIKNRAEYSQLSTELNRIDKEKRDELRMLATEKLRFKAKYARASFGSDTTTEASEVKMYETHNPGFCFRRNGEHRVPQTPLSSPPVDFEHLQFLLFTNGEVDIEKVLCLHLLSSHETEHLTLPRRPRHSSRIAKKDSPVEQLIERSKDYQIEATSSTGLPTYVLDVQKEKSSANRREDERLSSRLIINEKLLELITTVIRALEHSNPEKVQQLLVIAGDPSNLKRIFRKPHIQEFAMTLKEHSLISSCSSFILSQPVKCRTNHLEIRTASGALEDLVRYIRANVLQFPSRNSWKLLEEEPVTIQNNPLPVKKNIDTRKIRSPGIKTQVRIDQKDSRVDEEEEIDINKFKHIPKNFIEKNIVAVANFKMADEDEAPPKPKRPRRGSTDTRTSRSGSNKKIVEIDENIQAPKPSKRKSEDIKVHIKQTTCRACMEKYKQPLPAPKVPTVPKKASIESAGSKEGSLHVMPKPIKTNSIQRLSTMIEREKFKLESYDRKYSNLSTTSNFSQSKQKKVKRESVETVDLSVFDLEKVRQAVREKETRKKLEKFLGE